MRPYTGYRLTGPQGNNTFAYEQRTTYDPDPKLRLPALEQITSLDQIAFGTNPVFAELDDDNKVILFHGLRSIYHLAPSHQNPDIYIFDNHNYALYFWIHYVLTHPVKPLPVIHLDQHADLAPTAPPLPQNHGGQSRASEYDHALATYVTTQCHVGNFIQPALDAGFVSSCIWIKNQYMLEELVGKQIQKPYILDVDLDFWDPAMGTDLQKTLPLVHSLMRDASLVTIATSPYFLDQTYAGELLGYVCQNET